MIHIEPMDIDERASKMMLHYLKRKHFIILTGSFIAIYLVMLILGGVGPQYLITAPGRTLLNVCPNSDDDCNPITPILWSDSLGGLSKSNRFLNLYSDVKLHKSNSSVGMLDLPIYVELIGTEYDKVETVSRSNMTVTVECSGENCATFLSINQIGIDFPSYIVNLHLYSFNNISSVESISFTFYYVNSSYALSEMVARLLLVIITAAALAGFIFSLRKFNWRIWTLEQKFMVVLLGSLFFFNNPIFLLSLVTSGVGAEMIDDFFRSAFISILFYFWFVIFDGIRKNNMEYKFIKFYLPKLILSISFFISSLIAMSIFEYKLKHDPLNLDPSFTLTIFGVISGIIMIIFLIYLIYLIAKGWVTTKTLPFINIKLRLLLLLSVFVIIALGLGILFSWVDASGRNSIQFFSYYGLINLYIFALAILYLPHPNSDILYQSTILRDGAELPQKYEKEEDEFNEVYL